MPLSESMTLGERVYTLRQTTGLSQDAMGSLGFVSTPAWVKLENNLRQPSEKLIDNLVKWLVSSKHIKANASGAMREELLTLKYMGSNSAFVRNMARAHAKNLPNATALLSESKLPPRRRGRPPKVAR